MEKTGRCVGRTVSWESGEFTDELALGRSGYCCVLISLVKSVTQIVRVRQWCFGLLAGWRPRSRVGNDQTQQRRVARRSAERRENDFIRYFHDSLDSRGGWLTALFGRNVPPLELTPISVSISITRPPGLSLIESRRTPRCQPNATSRKRGCKIILEVMHDADSRDLWIAGGWDLKRPF